MMSSPELDGRCFAYVFPCVWEDHCKVGFTRDPLARIGALHPRWFEFFDLDRAWLVEADGEREARNLELALRGPLRAHKAPVPATVRAAAGGHTEWLRGASSALDDAVAALASQGQRVHPARGWLAAALAARSDLLYGWTQAQLTADMLEARTLPTAGARAVRDALDACAALGIEVEARVSDAVLTWWRRHRG